MLAWTMAVSFQGGDELTSFENFIKPFYDQMSQVNIYLLSFQGSRNVAKYVFNFHTLASESRYNGSALKVTFHQRLNWEIHTEMTYQYGKKTHDVFIDLDHLENSKPMQPMAAIWATLVPRSFLS